MSAYVVEIIMSIVLAVVGYLLFRLRKKLEAAEAALDDKQNEKIKEQMEEAMKPILEKLNDLNEKLVNSEALNKEFYKLQLINACKKYLAQKYITQYQFDNLSKIHQIYKAFGGNSQGDDYYRLVQNLPIRTAHIQPHNVNDRYEDELLVAPEDLDPTHRITVNEHNVADYMPDGWE